MNTISSTKLKIARENHCAELIKRDNKTYLIIIGGWDGNKALTNCEVFKIKIYDEKNVSLKICDEHQMELTTPRNKPVSITF